MMRIATDPATNGHSLMITPRSLASEGYMDVDREDYRDTAEDAWFGKLHVEGEGEGVRSHNMLWLEEETRGPGDVEGGSI